MAVQNSVGLNVTLITASLLNGIMPEDNEKNTSFAPFMLVNIKLTFEWFYAKCWMYLNDFDHVFEFDWCGASHFKIASQTIK